MSDINKSLIIKKDTIVKKIIDFFNKIFKKQNYIEETIDSEDIITNGDFETEKIFFQDDILEILDNAKYYSYFVKYDFPKDIDYEKEKKRVLDLYLDVKRGMIDIENLDAADLIKINKLLKSEVDLKIKNVMDRMKC